jgi:hypothetical protein
MAGKSAEDLARRQREKAGRLLRSAERWEQGASGERATGEVLDRLQAEGWTVFHDVRWPGRERANIDHVVVGPPGVFVIDSKNWSGRIEVRDGTFRAHGRRQDKTVAAAGEAASAVTALMGPPAAATTRSVLCFVRDEPVVGWSRDVMLCSTANLYEILAGRPRVLDDHHVRLAALELSVAFRAGAETAPPSIGERGRRRAASSRSRSTPAARATVRPHRGSSRRRRSASRELVSLAVFLVLAVALLNALPHLSEIGDRIGRAIAGQASPAYHSCRALRRVYPNGVGTAAAVNGLKRRHDRPVEGDALYDANRTLDADHDGVACEPGQRRR